MTMLQRLARAFRPGRPMDSQFEQYYSRILRSGDGGAGMPSAREAQRDLRDRSMLYRYL